MATNAAHLASLARTAISTPSPKARAQCGSPARRDLCGGRAEPMTQGPSLPQHEDLVLPVVAEVVGVAEASAEVDEFAERGLALVAEPELAVGDAELRLTEGEHVHVVVLPAERRLEDLVQLIEAGVGAKLQPPPDRRLCHAEQLDLDLHDDVVGGAVLAHRLLPWSLVGGSQPYGDPRTASGRGRSRVSLAGELLVVGDQAGEPSPERERPGVGALAVHRAVLVDRAGDGDEPSGGGVEDDGLLACFELVADDPVADLAERPGGRLVHRALRRRGWLGRLGREA